MPFIRAKAKARERAKEEKAEKEETVVSQEKVATGVGHLGNRLLAGASSAKVSTGPPNALTTS